MKLAIDSRYLGMSGIGRVLEGILDNLDYDNYEIALIGNESLKNQYPKANIIISNDNPFSKKGILSFPKEVNNYDCLFIPNFIIPYGIKIPVYCIVHDLIFLDMKEITTSGFIDYTLKKHLFKRCFKKAKKIFTVSNFTIDRCNHYFPKYVNKLILTYPGLSKNIIEYGKTHTYLKEKDNTIVYVGNVKPHKGLDILLEAFKNLNNDDYKLKIIGQKEKFLVGSTYDETKYKNVIFTGRITDEELMDEIMRAKYLVQPSLYEGFGVPPLEALYLGTIPVLSNIQVFKEVYSDLSVIFFENKEELTDILNKNIEKEITPREELLKKYNFSLMAEKVLNVMVNENGDNKHN